PPAPSPRPSGAPSPYPLPEGEGRMRGRSDSTGEGWPAELLSVAPTPPLPRPLSLWERARVRASRWARRPAQRPGVLASPPPGAGWGLAVAGGAGLWTVLCFAVIAPYFNGGGSLFWSRYAWLGETPARALV